MDEASKGDWLHHMHQKRNWFTLRYLRQSSSLLLLDFPFVLCFVPNQREKMDYKMCQNEQRPIKRQIEQERLQILKGEGKQI
jgi:hypothetical protein